MTKSACRPCGAPLAGSHIVHDQVRVWVGRQTGILRIGPTSQGVMAPSSDFFAFYGYLFDETINNKTLMQLPNKYSSRGYSIRAVMPSNYC